MGHNYSPASPVYRIFLAMTLLAACLAVWMAACSPNNQNQTQAISSGTPASTQTALPVSDETQNLPQVPAATSTAALIPIQTSQPVVESASSSAEIPPAAAPAEIDFGTADLAIIRPGQLSRHTSPVRVIANLNTLMPMETEITLFGEDGRVLATKTLWSKPYIDPLNGNLITDIEFGLPGLVETGRLELKTFDTYGRVWTLNSVYLILLSSGITDRNYAPEDQDRILLQLPFPDQRSINSSPIFISGLVRTTSDTPLTIALVDEAGNTVGEGQASVVLTPGSPYGQFVGEIPYQVSGPTRVLMIFGIQEGRIPGFAYIKTIEFTLQSANN